MNLYSNSKVSIAISVYNMEEYLVSCVESVETQTYGNIEIILSDDCSTDKSWDICKQLSEKYNNIIAIQNRTNMHQGATLEHALENATGEWLMFLDADDWLDADTVETMIEEGERSSADIVLAKFRYVSEHIKYKGHTCELANNNNPVWLTVKEMEDGPEIHPGVYDSRRMAEFFLEKFSVGQLSCIGNKLYNMDFIKNKKIFTETNLANYDLSFALDSFRSAAVISYLDRAFYNYYQHHGSSSGSYNPDMFYNFHRVRIKIKKWFEEEGIFEQKKKLYYKDNLYLIETALMQEFMYSEGSQEGFSNNFRDISRDADTIETVTVMSKERMSIKDSFFVWMVKKNRCLLAYNVLSIVYSLKGINKIGIGKKSS